MFGNLAVVLRTLLVVAAFGGFALWWWSPVLPGGVQGLFAWPPRFALTGSRPAGEIDAESAVPSPTARSVLAPNCPPGEPARFVLGFAELKRDVGDAMGDPMECEHVNPDNGDSLQQTTTGLAVFRKRDGLVAFTDGWHHWARTSSGIVTWTGDQEPASLRP